MAQAHHDTEEEAACMEQAHHATEMQDLPNVEAVVDHMVVVASSEVGVARSEVVVTRIAVPANRAAVGQAGARGQAAGTCRTAHHLAGLAAALPTGILSPHSGARSSLEDVQCVLGPCHPLEDT